MRRILHFVLLVLFVAAGVFFGSLNDHRVRVDYFFAQAEWPLALSLASFFFAGALFGGLITYLGAWVSMRRRLKAVRRQSEGAGQALMVSTPSAAGGGASAGSQARG